MFESSWLSRRMVNVLNRTAQTSRLFGNVDTELETTATRPWEDDASTSPVDPIAWSVSTLPEESSSETGGDATSAKSRYTNVIAKYGAAEDTSMSDAQIHSIKAKLQRMLAQPSAHTRHRPAERPTSHDRIDKPNPPSATALTSAGTLIRSLLQDFEEPLPEPRQSFGKTSLSGKEWIVAAQWRSRCEAYFA
jgi:hypothetical protein